MTSVYQSDFSLNAWSIKATSVKCDGARRKPNLLSLPGLRFSKWSNVAPFCFTYLRPYLESNKTFLWKISVIFWVNNNNNNCTRKIIRFYHQKTNQFFIDSKMSFKLFKILEESRKILSRSVMQQQNKIDNHQLKLY